ncbi:MAG: alginate export family protein, partial [Aquirufa sp.]
IRVFGQARLSFGGEWREQYQSYTYFNFGEVPADFVTASPHQLMHRILLHANLEFPHRVRVFAQMNNTARFWNPNPLNGMLDENLLSLHQAFIEIPLAPHLKIRAGKQEYAFGSERLIASKEGPNTRITFYGATLKYKKNIWRNLIPWACIARLLLKRPVLFGIPIKSGKIPNGKKFGLLKMH